MSKELEFTGRIIALESASHTGNYFSTSVDKFKLFFSDVSDSFKKSWKSIEGITSKNFIRMGESNIERLLGDLNYMSISKLEIPVPLGLKSNMTDYARDLHIQADGIGSIRHVLKNVVTELAKYVSNPKTLATGSIHPLRPDWKKNLAFNAEVFSRHLDVDSGKGAMTFGKAYRRLADFIEVEANARNLTQYMSRTVNLDELVELTERIDGLLTKLIAIIEDDKDIVVSNAVAGQLGDIAHMCACELEYAVAVYTKAQEFSTVVIEQTKRIEAYKKMA